MRDESDYGRRTKTRRFEARVTLQENVAVNDDEAATLYYKMKL